MMIPYLAFPGTCRAALEFYTQVFSGEIKFIKTFEEAPMPVPEAFQSRVFDSEFNAENIRFKASDDLPGHEVTVGTNISLFVSFRDASQQETIFQKLAENGSVLFPLQDGFGMVKDQFSIQWMIALAAE